MLRIKGVIEWSELGLSYENHVQWLDFSALGILDTIDADVSAESATSHRRDCLSNFDLVQ